MATLIMAAALRAPATAASCCIPLEVKGWKISDPVPEGGD